MPWQCGATAVRYGVLQTRVNQSAIAIENLKRQGFNYYNPRMNEMIRRGSRVSWRRVQLFKDYMFVEIVDRWRCLNGTRGVLRLLMDKNEQPAIISSEIINQIRMREDPETGLVVIKPRDKFEHGQSVQFKSGPFAWEHAIYDCKSGTDRAYVLMSMLGKQNRVQVDERSLVAA